MPELFVAVRVAMITVALAFSRHTTLWAHRLEKLVADRRRPRPRVYGGGTITSIHATFPCVRSRLVHPISLRWHARQG